MEVKEQIEVLTNDRNKWKEGFEKMEEDRDKNFFLLTKAKERLEKSEKMNDRLLSIIENFSRFFSMSQNIVGESMTVEEYNKEFYPKIRQASIAVKIMDSAIEHADISPFDQEKVRKSLALYNWSDEVKETILTALEYYRKHEGIDKMKIWEKKNE